MRRTSPNAGTGPPGNPPTEPAPKPSGPPPGPGREANDHPRTIAEAAAEIGIGYHKLRKLVAGNAVPCKKFGRSVRFYDDDIAAVKAQFQVMPRTSGRAA